MAGTLRELGEDAWIRRLVRRCGDQAPSLPAGIGDDASRMRCRSGRDLLWTTDLLVEDVHFRRGWTTPRMLGRKALAVNLSDVAAMGGLPRGFLLGLSAPGSLSVAWLDGLVAGLVDTARREGAPCLGGDTTGSSGPVTLSITAAGEVRPEHLLSRRGARAGDGLWVSGALGASAAGLHLLRSGTRLERPEGLRRAAAAVLKAHLDPRPPLGLGPWLARKRWARAAMDLSDGLARDLGRLCTASGVGAWVEAGAVPVHRAVPPIAARLGFDPLDAALHGGEDYELLFAVPPAREAGLQRAARSLKVRRIGGFGGPEVVLRQADGAERPLVPEGFQHFTAREA